MANITHRLLCFIKDDTEPFMVRVLSTTGIDELIKIIKTKNERFLERVDPTCLKLWKVRYF